MAHKILVVDDDADVRDMVCRTLEASGYVAIPAAGGRQAVERLERDPPDLVITDVVMPEVDGFEVLLKLRLLNPGVTALIMSGGGRLEPEFYLDMARRLGAQSILRKPFTRAEILHAVEQALLMQTSHPPQGVFMPTELTPQDMSPQDMSPLTLAFVHQSLAAARNHVRAQKAAQDGQAHAALALRALAEAQEVQAKKSLTFLRGRIGTSAENLAVALHEAREMAVSTLDWTLASEKLGDKAAGSLLTQMARAVESHLSLPGLAQTDQDKPPVRYHVCVICGYVHAGEAPERCPVCHAVPEKFCEVGA